MVAAAINSSRGLFESGSHMCPIRSSSRRDLRPNRHDLQNSQAPRRPASCGNTRQWDRNSFRAGRLEDRSRNSAVPQLRLLAGGGGIQPVDNSRPDWLRLLSYLRRIDAVAAQGVLHLRSRHLCAKCTSRIVRSRRCATFDTTSHSCCVFYGKCGGFSVGTLLGVFSRVFVGRLPPDILGACR